MYRTEYELDSLKSIRFFYNGVKINGEKKLWKVDYRLGNWEINYETNDTKNPEIYISPDYNDCSPVDLLFSYYNAAFTTVKPENPLYDYIYNATIQAQIHWFKTHMKWLERRLKEYVEKLAKAPNENERERCLRSKKEYEDSILRTKEKIDDYESKLLTLNPKNPSVETLDSYKEFIKKKNDAILEERERENKRKSQLAEQAYKLKASHKEYAQMLNKAYPLKEGEYQVEILWSESPALEDGMRMSLKAADIYLGFLDKEQHTNRVGKNEKEYTGWGWYDKTKFKIIDGEGDVIHVDRYDLGDGEVYNNRYGIISLIYCTAEGLQKRKNGYPNSIYAEADSQELFDLADKLYEFCYGKEETYITPHVKKVSAS